MFLSLSIYFYPVDLTKSYYTMREVSELLDLPEPTIRFYEREFGRVLQPVRTPTGHRRYRPKDIETLKNILFLLRDRGLRIEAARDELYRNRDGVARKTEAIEKLKKVRATLQGMLDALHQFR